MEKACEGVKLAITLETEDVEGAEDLENAKNVYNKIDMSFKSLVTEFSQDVDTE